MVQACRCCRPCWCTARLIWVRHCTMNVNGSHEVCDGKGMQVVQVYLEHRMPCQEVPIAWVAKGVSWSHGVGLTGLRS